MSNVIRLLHASGNLDRSAPVPRDPLLVRADPLHPSARQKLMRHFSFLWGWKAWNVLHLEGQRLGVGPLPQSAHPHPTQGSAGLLPAMTVSVLKRLSMDGAQPGDWTVPAYEWVARRFLTPARMGSSPTNSPNRPSTSSHSWTASLANNLPGLLPTSHSAESGGKSYA